MVYFAVPLALFVAGYSYPDSEWYSPRAPAGVVFWCSSMMPKEKDGSEWQAAYDRCVAVAVRRRQSR
jgi:hypothetical protein